MSDHIEMLARETGTRQIVGVRDLKTHAARILRHVRESRASYILTHRGRAIGVILPLDAADDAVSASEDEAADSWNAFVRAGRRLAPRFRPGVSGVRLLSAMRR